MNRRYVDDPPLGVLCLERAHHASAGEERAIEIGTDDPVELRKFHVDEHNAAHVQAGRIDQKADRAERFFGLLEQSFDRGFITDINLHRDRAVGPTDRGADRLRRGGILQIGDHNAGPGVAQQLGAGRANAGFTAGDHSNLIVEHGHHR